MVDSGVRGAGSFERQCRTRTNASFPHHPLCGHVVSLSDSDNNLGIMKIKEPDLAQVCSSKARARGAGAREHLSPGLQAQYCGCSAAPQRILLSHGSQPVQGTGVPTRFFRFADAEESYESGLRKCAACSACCKAWRVCCRSFNRCSNSAP